MSNRLFLSEQLFYYAQIFKAVANYQVYKTIESLRNVKQLLWSIQTVFNLMIGGSYTVEYCIPRKSISIHFIFITLSNFVAAGSRSFLTGFRTHERGSE